MSPGVVLLCGMSFSGESTVAAVIARELGAEVVSLDAIVFEEHVARFAAPGDDEPHLMAPPTTSIPALANDVLRPALDTR